MIFHVIAAEALKFNTGMTFLTHAYFMYTSFSLTYIRVHYVHTTQEDAFYSNAKRFVPPTKELSRFATHPISLLFPEKKDRKTNVSL